MAFQFQVLKFRMLCSYAAAVVAAPLLFGADKALSQAGPFSVIGGSWSGSGTIKKSNGGSERIRCRSSYQPSGSNLSLSIRCASDSYNIELSASVAYQSGAISGQWTESTRGIGGGISGQVSGSGSSVQAIASGPITSNITVSTKGNHQSVSIITPGSEVPEVSVSQERR